MKKLILTAAVFTMFVISCETTPTQVETTSTLDSLTVDSTIITLDSLSVVDTVTK